MIVTRFAPSPTGLLHLGHAYSAVHSHALGREGGGKFLLRIDDLDQGRSRPTFVESIFEDLQWLGLSWDHPMLVESERAPLYQAALEELRARGLVYACFCTRNDIAAALEAPHGQHGHYPGTCRNLADNPEERASRPHCWRLDSGKALERVGLPSWNDANGRLFQTEPADFGDIVLARKDAPSSYHLACVLDDHESGVTLVTRGADLRASVPAQRLLQNLLGLSEPAYFHHRLVCNDDGRRLAKRDQAPTLQSLRSGGWDGHQLREELLEDRLPLGFTFMEV